MQLACPHWANNRHVLHQLAHPLCYHLNITATAARFVTIRPGPRSTKTMDFDMAVDARDEQGQTENRIKKAPAIAGTLVPIQWIEG